MDLTREQILEMTETIARACGWKPVNNGMFIELKVTEDFMGNLDTFDPFESWDDFHLACDAMGVGLIHHLTIGERRHSCKLWGNIAYVAYEESDKQTAAFLALYEYAKRKLEASE